MKHHLKKLFVYIHQKCNIQKVGTLATKDRKIYFEYDQDFLKTGIELSPYKLPLKAGVQRCDDDLFEGLWGLFADSLPDGWGRLLIDRYFLKQGINPATLSPLDRLALAGCHTMGALSYEPEQEIAGTLDEIVLDDLAQSSQQILEGNSDLLLDELLSLGGSSAGARPKVLVQMNDNRTEIIHGRQKLKEGFSHWMVKFASGTDGREIGAVEYAYSLMAKAAGIEMPRTALLEGKRGRYFAIERFDRVGDGRLHMHSVAGLTHSDFRFPTLDYDDLLNLTLHLTKSVPQQEKMFRLACFNLFVHNRDDHAKNFSFLMDSSGEWRLSPAYDLTFSYGPGGEHSTMYAGEGRQPGKEHLEVLGKKYRIKRYGQIIDEVRNAVNLWGEFAKETGVSSQVLQNITRRMKI